MEDKNYKTTIKKSVEHIEKLSKITGKDKHLSIESKMMVTMGLLGLQETLLKALDELGNEWLSCDSE